MGIIKLMDFIKTKCPTAITHKSPLNYKQKTLAIDTPSAIYKFLVKTITSSKDKLNVPMDSKGNQTGHLIGVMYRALLCIQMGIKPIWVFDGKPPKQKLTELKRRKAIKDQAEQKSEEALSLGDMIQAARQSKRTIKITKQQIEDCVYLLNLMGMPTVRSYGQAEAQCAWLNKNKLCDGIISQDLDTLAFGGNCLIREFARDKAAIQINRQKLLQLMKMNQDQFVDFCILCGCDYTSKISNIGPVKGYKLIKDHGSIQEAIKAIINDDKSRKKYEVPDDFNFLRARNLFRSPLVNDMIGLEQLEQRQINYEGLKQFLNEKQFSQNRIERWIQVAKTCRQKQKQILKAKEQLATQSDSKDANQDQSLNYQLLKESQTSKTGNDDQRINLVK